jgi:hypothetical protein
MTSGPESQTDEADQRQPPKRARKPIVVRVFRALIRQKNKRRRRNQPEQSQHQINEGIMARWTRRVGWFTGALVIVSLITAWIFKAQLDESKQARLPFLSVKEIQIIARTVDGVRTWEPVLIWENTGGTEALDILAETTWFEVAPGLTGERHVVPIPKFFLAPHLVTSVSRFSVSDDLLKMVRSGKKQITVQWIAIYRDKFGTDLDVNSRHETRQGWILRRIDDDPGKIKINEPIKVTWDAQPDFTCVDRGCKDAKQ